MDKEIKEQEPVSMMELGTLIGGMLVGPMWAEFHKLIPYNRGVLITLLSFLEPEMSTEQINRVADSAMAEMAAEFIEMALTVAQVVEKELRKERVGKSMLQ